MEALQSLLENKLNNNEIINNRKEFKQHIKNINLFNKKILKISFYYLLHKYLDDQITYPIEFEYSKRLKKVAASFKIYKSDNYSYKLTISKPIIESLFLNNEEYLEINGLICYDHLDCFMALMEHEFIHFIISECNPDDWQNGAHSKQFKILMNNIFGHTKHTHNLFLFNNNTIKNKLIIGEIYKIKDKNITKGLLLKLNSQTALIEFNKSTYRVPYELFDL
jgi:hypothetical protein